MDGVLVDFQSTFDQVSEEEKNKYETMCEIPYIFGKMKPMEGAIDAFNELSEHFDVYILSTSPWNNTTASMEKLAWVKKYLGEKAFRRLILSHNKNLNKGDFLVDDTQKNGAGEFEGELIQFGTEKFPNWNITKEYLLQRK